MALCSKAYQCDLGHHLCGIKKQILQLYAAKEVLDWEQHLKLYTIEAYKQLQTANIIWLL